MRNLLALTLLATLSLWAAENTLPDELLKKYYQSEVIVTDDGELLEKITINGPPTPPPNFERLTVSASDLTKRDGIRMIDAGELEVTLGSSSAIPAYNWSFGCSPTSAAMMAAWYDRNGYPNIYTGPTGGGLAPTDNSMYPDVVINGETRHQSPLSATHKGLDGRTIRGHVDDYWFKYLSTATDPYYGHWTEHTYGSCTGDYMKANQWYHGYENPDGGTSFYCYNSGAPFTAVDMELYDIQNMDGAYGMKLFFESRGYVVTTLYTQNIDTRYSGGFSFTQYKAEINAGRPVMLLLEGHAMEGIGYKDPNIVLLHDTWDYNVHEMTWGGSYSGMILRAVSVIHISMPDPTESFPRVMADINGDGMADIIGFGTKGISVALSNGSDFTGRSLWLEDFGYNQGWTTDKSLRKMADVDGDGLADVVGFGNNGVSVALSNGTSFVNARRWVDDFGYNQGWRNDKSLRIMADVNGDGMADIVGFGNNGVSVALSNGSDFDNASRWVDDFGYNQGWRNDKSLRIMADVNGDGMADIVGFGNNGVSVALSNGSDFDNASRWVDDFGYNQGWRNDKGLRFMSDVNGDGKADIVGFGNAGVSVALSNGNSFVNAQRWVDDFGYNQGWTNDKGVRIMADINGDGKADIVGFGNNGVSVAYSNGNSFTGTSRKIDDFGYNQGWKNYKHLRLMADVDGDGTADVVGFGNGGVSVSTSTGDDFDSASSWLNDFGYDQGWKVDFSPYQEQQ